MLKIVIPDPGLREYGGHHPGMINSIANTQSVLQGELELEVFCHKKCSDEFITATQSEKVRITKHFNTDFYQYFYKTPSLVVLNGYINQLTKEYLSIFEHYRVDAKNKTSTTENTNILFLYHTLNAEHAIALGGAIAIYNKRYHTPYRHCVFFMFNPIKRNESGQFNNKHFLNFKLGFSLLAKQEFVQCYAAEEELQQNYQFLFSSKKRNSKKLNTAPPKKVSIHPCGLLTQSKLEVKKEQRVILFSGDAKANKGFNALPALIERATKEIENNDVEFVIQYTITNNSDVLNQTEKKIQQQASLDSRIKIVNRFWSHEELHDNFAKANCIVFNYDSVSYQHQSSGVLWLAAFYNLNMVFLTSNWLMREAKKLSCQYDFCSNTSFPHRIDKYLMQNISSFDKVLINEYRNVLFQDIGKWLLSLIR